MKELEVLVDDLDKYLVNKETEVNDSDTTPNSYILASLQNRRNDILDFKESSLQVSRDPFQRNVIIENFTKTF